MQSVAVSNNESADIPPSAIVILAFSNTRS
jgi:hypothetical protein